MCRYNYFILHKVSVIVDGMKWGFILREVLEEFVRVRLLF